MQPYEQFRGHKADFLVKYRLYAPSDGGRKITFQHLRCDFLYEGDDPHTNGLFMIHPEFLDASGQPIAEGIPVPLESTASMWLDRPIIPDDVSGRLDFTNQPPSGEMPRVQT